MKHQIETFYDEVTSTLTYVLYNEKSKDAVVIDPVLDYDPAASQISFESINKLTNFIEKKKLNVHYILETHAHADHLTGAAELKKRFNHAKVAIGKNITKVQKLFSNVFNLKELKTDGSQFDLLLEENSVIDAGTIKIKTIFTPGHTPACSSYLIDDMLFTGDALFMPDYGTGRCDFPSGSASELYHSVHEKLYKLPDATKVFTGHDYQPNGRTLEFESTIGENKKNNIHLRSDTSKEDFVERRQKRDATLKAPKLLLPSIQVNIDAGHLPAAEDNGVSFLKIPVKSKES